MSVSPNKLEETSVPQRKVENPVKPPKVNTSKKKKRFINSETIAGYLFLTPNIIGFLTFTAFPVIASFLLGFFSWEMLKGPEFLGLQNFKNLFLDDPLFLQVVKNTIYYVGLYLPLNLVIAICLALWVCTIKKGSWIFRSLFFLPVLAPTVAAAFIWKFLFQPEGLINQTLALFNIAGPNWLGDTKYAMVAIIIMSVWKQFGYNMVIFIAGLQAIPNSLYESSKIDGANAWQRFWKITLPLLSPSLFFATVMTLITSFQVFDQAMVMTGGGPVNSTNTIVMYIYEQGFQSFNMGYAASIAWMLFAVIFLVTIFQMYLQKKWVHYE